MSDYHANNSNYIDEPLQNDEEELDIELDDQHATKILESLRRKLRISDAHDTIGILTVDNDVSVQFVSGEMQDLYLTINSEISGFVVLMPKELKALLKVLKFATKIIETHNDVLVGLRKECYVTKEQ